MFSAGFGVAQLVHGPLADRFGRRPVLIGALAWYVVMNLLCALAGSLDLLLLARVFAGLGIAATRVVTIALIRDCYSGRAMARVSSLAVMTFMIFPIIAPSIGELILKFGSWRLIFNMIAIVSAVIAAWFILRMPETLAPENRVPLEWNRLVANWRFTLADRQSVGYAAAVIGLQGALFGYITSIQPIVSSVFHQPDELGLVFALCAGMMMCGNLLNSRIVMWLGMRRISHGAMLVLILAASTSLAIEHLGLETLWLFVAMQAVTMMCFGLAASNCSAMAMANMGAIAGTASSLQGFVVTTGGAVIGGLIGRSFDGTTTPLHLGFLTAGHRRADAGGDRRARTAVSPDLTGSPRRAGTTAAPSRSLSNQSGDGAWAVIRCRARERATTGSTRKAMTRASAPKSSRRRATGRATAR